MKFLEYINEGQLVNIIEQKKVGIVYHFTKYRNMIKILKGNKEYKLNAFDLISYNGVISTTRNYSMSDDILNTFRLQDYNIRIALDGDRISEKYKIKPIAGYTDNDGDIFDKNKNYKRVKRQEGESEEAIISKKINIQKYIKEIQIYNYNDTRDNKYKEEIEKLVKPFGITVNLVRKFKPFNESIDEQGFEICI